MPGLGFISSLFPDPARGLWSWFRYAPKTLSPFAGTISESVFGRWTVETALPIWNPPGPFSSFVSLASAFSASKCWECSLEYRLLEKRTGRMFTRLRAYPSENPIARQYSPHLISWGVCLTLTYSMLNLIPKTRITKNYPIYFDSDEILLPAQAWKIVSRL